MIMFPTQDLHKQQQQKQQDKQDCYGGFGEISSYTSGSNFNGVMKKETEGYDNCYSEVCLESSLTDLLVLVGDQNQYHHHHMAEDGSRTSSINEEAGSSSKDEVVLVVKQQDIDQYQNKDDNWLKLGLGNSSSSAINNSSNQQKYTNPSSVMEEQMTQRNSGLVELDLLSGSSSIQQPINPRTDDQFRTSSSPLTRPPPLNIHSLGGTNINMPLLFHQQQQQQRTSLNLSHLQLQHLHQSSGDQRAWVSLYRPNLLWNQTVAAGSSSSMMPMMNSYFSRSFQHSNMDTAGPSNSEMLRVIDAPPRPHSGIWFVLQASPNQSKEPFLPQIPKSYLRIKDGRMTVRLLMKYLVNKLRLNIESEIEIRCRGEQLEPNLTLQHVRDQIWNSKEMVTLLPDSSTSHHVMILHYGWTTSPSSFSPPN